MANVESTPTLAGKWRLQHEGRAMRSHCRNDHAYDEANTYYWMNAKGRIIRYCRACRNDEQELRHREGELRRRYGITPADYDRLLSAQGNCCAICKGPPTKSYRAFDVDHDHETGRVRGLLCRRCNIGISYFEDGSFRENAVVYLAEGVFVWPA